ncbi:MAG TPA: TIGR02710 family CRISPR-associated CARF protein [Glycomyces sp.]|nr:TIGR02710 family CRISPR-associated CARF protein [Glycomyces sp.]
MSGEEEYDGNGTSAEQALRYRHEKLVPKALRRIQDEGSALPHGAVDLLVSLSGFSPETTVFAAAFIRPKDLLVLVSHTARNGIDLIRRHAAPGLHIDVQQVDPLDPVDIYERIRKAVDDFKRFNSVPNPRVVIDITGGKKSMAAGAALAATQLDSPMCYIDGDFNPEIRQSEPGSERLVILDNPTKLFGDRQQEAAEIEFGHGAFDAAFRRFESIVRTSPTPARARFGCDLSELYTAWSDLEFDRLGTAVAAMRARLDDSAYRCAPDTERQLRAQLEFLGTLARRREGEPLVLTFYLLGRHYQEHGRRDFATLLYYRMLESLFEIRLAEHGISSSDPDWNEADPDPDAFIERYRNLSEAVFEREFRGMPFKVGMVESALLLHVLNDPMLPRFGLDGPKALRYLRSMSAARNDSVLAHGKATVSKEVTEKLGSLALRALRAYWGLVHRAEDVEDRIAELRFVDPWPR